MLVFESVTPEALLKEVAEYIRQQAARAAHEAAGSTLKRDKELSKARANALTLLAMELEEASILPRDSALRTTNPACPHCHRTAQRINCRKCTRQMCAACISYGELCGSCFDAQNAAS